MLETDKIPVFCIPCGRESSHQIGWLRTQAMLACPLCGNDITAEMGEALDKVPAQARAS